MATRKLGMAPYVYGVTAYWQGAGLDHNPYSAFDFENPARYRPWQEWRNGWLDCLIFAGRAPDTAIDKDRTPTD